MRANPEVVSGGWNRAIASGIADHPCPIVGFRYNALPREYNDAHTWHWQSTKNSVHMKSFRRPGRALSLERTSFDMTFLKVASFLAVSALIAVASPRVLLAQGVDAQMLLHPPADSWPGY